MVVGASISVEGVDSGLAIDDSAHPDQRGDIRIWMDGAFDMMHFGHMNAFRQGRALGTTLIVGMNNDESITACKGKPVNNEEERMETVRGCKWVDEIVADVPYIMNETYLKEIMVKHRIDFIVHGDDPCIVDGKDVYETAQKLGNYLTIPRTEGISTTAIVGRILTHLKNQSAPREDHDVCRTSSTGCDLDLLSSLIHGKSNFLTTTRMLRLFSENVKAPAEGARVVYIGGTWDLLHAGHLSVLQQARDYGDYLIVGIYSDALASILHSRTKKSANAIASTFSEVDLKKNQEMETVKSIETLHQDYAYPILSMEERMLSLLGCKHVSDVLMNAPHVLSSDFLSALGVSFVVTDIPQDIAIESDEIKLSSNTLEQKNEDKENADKKVSNVLADESDPLRIPREEKILRLVEPSFTITAAEIMDRIGLQEEQFKKKFEKKKKIEEEYYFARYEKVK